MSWGLVNIGLFCITLKEEYHALLSRRHSYFLLTLFRSQRTTFEICYAREKIHSISSLNLVCTEVFAHVTQFMLELQNETSKPESRTEFHLRLCQLQKSSVTEHACQEHQTRQTINI